MNSELSSEASDSHSFFLLSFSLLVHHILWLPPPPKMLSACLFSEKEMTTHSILAWRILWTEEPGGLPTMGSHRVRHDGNDLAAAAAAACLLAKYF